MIDMSGALPVTRGAFPHLRVAAGLAWVSGTSSRRVDNTIEGTAVTVDGTLQLDPVLQSRAVLANVEQILVRVGLDRTDLVDVTAFLIDMGHFDAWNAVWTDFFRDCEAPARTTVAVQALPHPHLLLEVKAVARLRGDH